VYVSLNHVSNIYIYNGWHLLNIYSALRLFLQMLSFLFKFNNDFFWFWQHEVPVFYLIAKRVCLMFEKISFTFMRFCIELVVVEFCETFLARVSLHITSKNTLLLISRYFVCEFILMLLAHADCACHFSMPFVSSALQWRWMRKEKHIRVFI